MHWSISTLLLKDEGVIIRHLLVLPIHFDDLRENMHPNLHIGIGCTRESQVAICEVESYRVGPKGSNDSLVDFVLRLKLIL